MRKSYSSNQMGIVNMNFTSVNFLSLLLGVLIILSVWMLCWCCSSCKLFGRKHQNQSIVLHSIAQSLGQRQATPAVLPPIRGTDPLFLDL